MREYKDDTPLLSFLYRTVLGRILLKGLAAPWVSRLAGCYLNTKFSKCHIPRFVEKNRVDLSQCQKQTFDSFNDFFVRELTGDARPVDHDPQSLIAPCDGLLCAYPITPDTKFAIKGRTYCVEELLGGDPQSERYQNGLCLVFRLCVNDYHRYHYIDSGHKTENHFLPGKLHTVRPIAMRAVPLFHENSREYTYLHTDHFGVVAQIEIGALLVGKIQNNHGVSTFQRGAEKGKFLFGGSTVVLLLEAGRAELLPQFPMDDQERQVRFGQAIGRTIVNN